MKALFLALSLLAHACDSASGQAASRLPIREAVFQLPTTLDPHAALVPDWNRFWVQVYETPLQCQFVNGELVVAPLLLRSMPQVSKDGLTYTLNFREGIRFQDDPCFDGGKGRGLTASDFAYVLRRHIDPAYGSVFFGAYLSGRLKGADAAARKAADDGLMDYSIPISGITVQSSTSLVLSFLEPYPQFTALLSMPWLSLVPREAIARYGSAIAEHMVGTGPYLHVRKGSNSRQLNFTANPNYWDQASGLPANGGVRFSLLTELEHHEMRFQSGEIDLLDLWAVNRSKFLTRTGRVKRSVRPRKSRRVATTNAQLQYVSFNMRGKFLGQRKVRQALALAFDRKAYNREFYQGTAILAEHMVPPCLPIGQEGARQEWEYGKADLKRARALLESAGFKGGAGLPEFLLDFNYTGEEADRQAKFFAKQWSRIGVRAQTRTQDFATFVGRVRDGVTQIAVSGWFADYPDPENFFLMLSSSSAPVPGVAVDSPNVGFFSSPRYDRLYRNLCQLPYGKQRASLSRTLVAIAQEECPWIFLVHPVRETLVAPGITGFTCRSNYAASLARVVTSVKPDEER